VCARRKTLPLCATRYKLHPLIRPLETQQNILRFNSAPKSLSLGSTTSELNGNRGPNGIVAGEVIRHFIPSCLPCSSK
ncbi:MAG: hypothetical protein ABIR80_17080, partial [Opitutaceae bacterium]